jgi:hypothetical protein
LGVSRRYGREAGLRLDTVADRVANVL